MPYKNMLALSNVQRPLKFFIAGAIQGSREGTLGVDQEYRRTLRRIIIDCYPDATIICPLALLKERFSDREDTARADFERETNSGLLNAKEYGPVVSEIRAAFCELTRVAAEADVLIAYLPDHEASMGTAMEMWSAYSHDRQVITITSMTRNLSIVATSGVVLPSIDEFESFLLAGRLTELL